MGDDTYVDWQNITPDELYAWSDEHNTTPVTAAFSVGDAENTLREAVGKKEDVIFFGISTCLSASCNTFKIAAGNLDYSDHVAVIDSRNLCTGIGLLILKAAEKIARGETDLQRLEDYVNHFIPYVRTTSVIETLTCIHRRGRCSAATALIGSALKIKPKILVKDGGLDVARKYRKRQPDVIRRYYEDLEPLLKNADPDHVFISHTGGCPRKSSMRSRTGSGLSGTSKTSTSPGPGASSPSPGAPARWGFSMSPQTPTPAGETA